MIHTLASPARYEEVIKKSRFVAKAAWTGSTESAGAFVQAESDRDATHNCWAYRIGAQYRFSDAGEPGGTAGRPILQAIDSQGLDQVVVVVTRFFGGIKLGAGGLVRAYGGTASQCLRLGEKRAIVALTRWRIQAPFEASGAVYAWIEKAGIHKVGETFSTHGVEVDVDIVEDDCEGRLDELRDTTRGKAVAVQLSSEGRPE